MLSVAETLENRPSFMQEESTAEPRVNTSHLRIAPLSPQLDPHVPGVWLSIVHTVPHHRLAVE